MIQKTKNKGFSLMEVIIAVAVIITALIAAMTLISFSVSAITSSKSKITATNLAQEGLEIVRNIRDSNWVGPDYKMRYDGGSEDWRNGLGLGDPDPKQYLVQYNQPGLLDWSSTPLQIDSSGFYQYDSGTNTPFYRKIIIEYIGNNQIKVTAEITWQEKGRSQIIQVEDRLYNWLQEE